MIGELRLTLEDLSDIGQALRKQADVLNAVIPAPKETVARLDRLSKVFFEEAERRAEAL